MRDTGVNWQQPPSELLLHLKLVVSLEPLHGLLLVMKMVTNCIHSLRVYSRPGSTTATRGQQPRSSEMLAANIAYAT